jgi:hypothetical protein
MSIYQIQINERTSIGKSLVNFLQSIPQIVTFEKREKNRSLKVNCMRVLTVHLPMYA